jgi:hypothetical protein
MATLYLARKLRYKIAGRLAFLILGCAELIISLPAIMPAINSGYVYDLWFIVFWGVFFFSALAALVGGILIIVTAFKK